MSLVNLHDYQFGFPLIGGMRQSIGAVLRIRAGATIEPGQSSLDKENREKMRGYTSMRRRILEDGPSCPSCCATMDTSGYSFASKIDVDGVTYYCNNPVCNGIRQSSLIAETSTTKESVTRDQNLEAGSTDYETKELKMI